MCDARISSLRPCLAMQKCCGMLSQALSCDCTWSSCPYTSRKPCSRQVFTSAELLQFDGKSPNKPILTSARTLATSHLPAADAPLFNCTLCVQGCVKWPEWMLAVVAATERNVHPLSCAMKVTLLHEESCWGLGCSHTRIFQCVQFLRVEGNSMHDCLMERSLGASTTSAAQRSPSGQGAPWTRTFLRGLDVRVKHSFN